VGRRPQVLGSCECVGNDARLHNDPWPDPNLDADDSNTRSNADCHADAEPFTKSDGTELLADPDPDAHTHSYADPNANTYLEPDPDSYTHSDAAPNRHADGRSDLGRWPSPVVSER
jgi:hypothetical protein